MKYIVVWWKLCQAFYCPIDTSLSFVQGNKLIRELTPAHVVISRQYTLPPTAFSQRQDLVIDSVIMMLQFVILTTCYLNNSAFELRCAFVNCFSIWK